MPRELIASDREQLAFRDYASPPLQADQLRVRTRFAAAKHGTEMALYKGYASPRGRYDTEYQLFRPEDAGVRYPVALGNICIGDVIEIGAAVEQYQLGDQVFRYAPFREEQVWPAATVRRLPATVPWQAAACLDPADFALGALRDGHVRIGDAVAIFGMGAIGLVALQLAKLAGADPVIAVEPLAIRQAAAVACGADLVIDPAREDAGFAIKQATEKRGADVCIDYSGHYLALQGALRGVAYLGTVVAGAWPGAYPAGLDLGAEAHMNRPTIIFSRACSEPNPDYPSWTENRLLSVCWRLLSEGKIKCEPIVQPIVNFADLLVEYPKIATHPNENVKLGVRFP
ncbi:MAG: zinc-binding alcohol dehydrogenase [Caldilineaceae bacterium]|nr:zinc-binding alcohol dehydrogenase [Caldilineaceae bacterium]